MMTWTHEHAWTLDALPSAVFEALTEPAQLTHWFAEHVDVGSAVGEPFRFWGKHTLATPSAGLATQRITQWSADRTLAFSWTIGGVATEVSLALSAHVPQAPPLADGIAEADAGAATVATTQTKLVLHHLVSGTLPYPRERELVDDHWRFVFGNLAGQLRGDGGIVLPDFTDPAPEVRQVIMIDAPREVVFRTLITPELVNQWFGSKVAVVEPHVGGRYETGWRYKIDGRDVVGGPTRILAFVENEQLTLDWPDWRGDTTVSGQTISFTLETVGAQTRVTFVHAGFDRTTDLSDYPFGWTYFLGNLRTTATERR